MNILIGLLSKYVFGVVIKYIMEQIFISLKKVLCLDFGSEGEICIC